VAEVGGGNCVLSDKTGCRCGAYACGTSTLGCACYFDGDGSSTSCSATGGDVCCLRLDASDVHCKCELSSCTASLGEYKVTSCDKDVVLAALRGGERVVDRCSN
jgi:hypothetical protein